MSISRVLNLRTFAFVIVAMVLATVAYGFAASNTIPETGAGDGADVISGYDITNVTYDLAVSDPATIGTVSFNLAPTAGAGAATEVSITLENGGTWFECDAAGAPAITCDIAGAVAVLDTDELRVVAVQ